MKSKEFRVTVNIKAYVSPDVENEYSPSLADLQEAVIRFFRYASIRRTAINDIEFDFDEKHIQIKALK